MTEETFYEVSDEQNALLSNYNSRVQSLEALGGLAPGDVSDATVSSVMAQLDSQTRAAFEAALADTTEDQSSRFRGALREAFMTSAVDAARLQPALTSLAAEVGMGWFGGDSITERANVSGPGKGYIDVIRNEIQRKYNPFYAPGGKGFVGVSGIFKDFQPSEWVLSGGAGVVWDGKALGGFYANLNAAGKKMSMTFEGTGVELIYTEYATSEDAASLRVRVDGVVQPRPRFQYDGLAGGLGQGWGGRHVVGGFTRGTHTIEVEQISGTAPFYFHGGVILDGDESAGFRQMMSARSGAQVTTVSGTVEHFRGWPIKLATVYFGTNEYRSNTTSAAFATNLESYAKRILDNVRPRPTLLLLKGYEPAGGGGTRIEPWANYRAAVDQVGATLGVPVLDLAPLFNEGVIASPYSTDGVHPTDLGHQMIGEAVIKFLGV